MIWLVEAIEPGLTLRHDLRLEATVTIARRLDRQRAEVALQGFRRRDVAGVAAVVPGRIALLVAEVHRHLGSHRAFKYRFGGLL